MRVRYQLFSILLVFSLASASLAGSGAMSPKPEVQTVPLHTDGKLREQLKTLTEALNKRDLETIRAQISPSRIYVEISDKAGAYLSSNQTLVVMESFFRTRTTISSSFEFVNDDGFSGTASGVLTARKDGKTISYKLNFGFSKAQKGNWLLTRISMR